MRERGGGGGQASIEVLALVPVLVLVAFGAVWVATMLADVSRAQDEARVRALAATGVSGTTTVITRSRGAVTVRVGIRLP